LPAPTARSRRKNTVVSTETISTQNMTGFLTRVRGLSFLTEAQIGTISERSRIASGRIWRRTSSVGCSSIVGVMSVISEIPRKT
jgi:hypothetical protein